MNCFGPHILGFVKSRAHAGEYLRITKPKPALHTFGLDSEMRGDTGIKPGVCGVVDNTCYFAR